MTREEAKRILRLYRPGSSDHQDPEVAEALGMAREDRELQAWLREQTSFQSAVRAGLRQIVVPPGLKEAILARRKIVVPLWRRPELLLLAACVAVALVIAALAISRPPGEATFAGFRSRMVSFALRVYRMDIVTNDPNQVRDFLRAEGAPADYALTAGLAKIPVKGGARLSWQGHPVSMVCFDLPRNQTLYMFVMDKTALAGGEVPGPAPTISAVHGMPTAAWERNGKIYLIAAPADAADLRNLVAKSLREGTRVAVSEQNDSEPSIVILVNAGVSEQPIEVRPLVSAEREGQAGSVWFGGAFGAADDPVVDFGVAIGKTEIG